jgi:2-polyprenyl-3-methyl-5-hydroxy-6-metoxy-1,4-benzoquinol methylase
MALIDNKRINEYGNSMFRHEQLSEKWIALCSNYLRALFGGTLRGKTVIDYAFGRGNWSLAFLDAGAAKVIAIDAAEDAVDRFKSYCQRRNVANIEIVLGNILERDFAVRGDLIWLYGILPNIEDQTVFLTRIKSLVSGPDAEIYVFHYNASSLREFTVQTCRRTILYQSEAKFRRDSYLFVRPARLRARDDLTAPHVNFFTAGEVKSLLKNCGIYIKRQDQDFQQFLHGRATEDFYPHQFLCSLRSHDEIEIEDRRVPYAKEVRVLKEVARQVSSLHLPVAEKKNVAIGLYNTHFAFLKARGGARDAVIEIFLLLMYVILQNRVSASTLSPAIAPYYHLFCAALAGEDRVRKLRLLSEHSETMGANKLMEYLVKQNIRS